MMNTSNIPLEIQGNSEIRVIGPRHSGKTSFMAALARWPNADPNSPIQAVDPFDNETGRLIGFAKDILEDGRELAPTDYADTADNLPSYTLLITLKPNLFNHPIAGIRGRPIRIQVSCREYTGEIFSELRNIATPNARLNSYLDDCASASGLLLLLDGTARTDKEDAQTLETLQRELNERLSLNKRVLRDYRIAVVFSKSEQAVVWVHRKDIRKFANLRFSSTQAVLQKWSKTWGCSINYFFCSAFGTKGTPPAPNVRVINRDIGGTSAVIDRPNVWRPCGLVAPLYWLHTGQEDPRLRDI